MMPGRRLSDAAHRFMLATDDDFADKFHTGDALYSILQLP